MEMFAGEYEQISEYLACAFGAADSPSRGPAPPAGKPPPGRRPSVGRRLAAKSRIRPRRIASLVPRLQPVLEADEEDKDSVVSAPARCSYR
mmetsp:Transcript_45944/g.99836  ORF Transcript_45944/g.99836 Transcript_45944/m.99836 type:complete len:91 (+) Transcript_45944:129-401(+)